MMRTEPTQGHTVQCRLYRVCWSNSITRERGMSGPMSLAQAEFLVRDESIGTSFRRFWIEPWIAADTIADDEAVRPLRRKGPAARMN
ncbi:hypothetical protein [Caenispirillum bisanense]|uniref:hypothetical protein n=1 Tax=Caenispirillum bisanense TaxID=414052 RepID=UPI0031D4552D